jgi:hypothetical protein
MTIIFSEGKTFPIGIVRCIRHANGCFEVGARFTEGPA